MKLSRLTMEPRALQGKTRDRDPTYVLHQELWRCFAENKDEATRPFIYRVDQEQRDGNIRTVAYSLSDREPAPRDGWAVETTEYAPRLTAGDELAFRLRFNPVISRSAGPGQRGKRHDLVMDLKRRTREAGHTMDQETLWRTAAMEWFEHRMPQIGFDLEPHRLRVESYDQHDFRKPDGGRVRFSSLDVSGILQVVDPDMFLGRIQEGIGPAKGFGMGLLLLRRA